MTRVARPARTRKPRQLITGPERDQLRAAVAALNAEHYHDPEIGDQLGIPRHVVRALREEAGVAPIPKPPPARRRTADSELRYLKDCPECTLLVTVKRDTIEGHQRFTGETTRGVMFGFPVPAVAPCPAGGGKYSTWLLKGTPA